MFTIDAQEYHLGDASVSGWPPPVGRSWSVPFLLSTAADEATLVIDIRSSQAADNAVFLNGHRIGCLAQNPANSGYLSSRHPVPQGVLRKGENMLSLNAGLRAREPNDDYDEVLFKNVRLEFPSPPDRLKELCAHLRDRLDLQGYAELVPPQPLTLAFVKQKYAANYVFAVVDARESQLSPQQIFDSVKDWFGKAIGRRERGALLYVYDPALASRVAEIQKAGRFYTHSVAVELGAYDLSTGEHWPSHFETAILD